MSRNIILKDSKHIHNKKSNLGLLRVPYLYRRLFLTLFTQKLKLGLLRVPYLYRRVFLTLFACVNFILDSPQRFNECNKDCVWDLSGSMKNSSQSFMDISLFCCVEQSITSMNLLLPTWLRTCRTYCLSLLMRRKINLENYCNLLHFLPPHMLPYIKSYHY
jgi:hypothetical protein